MCAYFCYKMVHCGIFVWWVVRIVKWWRHNMEIFSALLTLCVREYVCLCVRGWGGGWGWEAEGVAGSSQAQGANDAELLCFRPNAHCDVTVMFWLDSGTLIDVMMPFREAVPSHAGPLSGPLFNNEIYCYLLSKKRCGPPLRSPRIAWLEGIVTSGRQQRNGTAISTIRNHGVYK